MKWRKLGQIFDPTKVALPEGCVAYAQSPQALVLENRIRIYFSTRAIDKIGGKYRSHVAFVEMSRDLGQIIAVSPRSVIPLGGLGAFDEHGIFPMNVLRHRDSLLAYTCGWSRRISTPIETSIGLAASRDGGLSFVKCGDGPILGASLNEPFLVGDAFVKVFDGVFHMWYIFGTAWKRSAPGLAPDRTYKIGHATSSDGVNWTKEEGRRIIADRLGHDECQALPSVIAIDGAYHMFFCYRESADFRTNYSRAYRIGHAASWDLQHWTRDDENPGIEPSRDSWDSEMMCYPHAFHCDDRVYLLYNGNEFGRFGFGVAVLE